MDYVGSELELFAKAEKWKKYWSQVIQPFVRGDVLEVGAGLGGNIPYIGDGAASYTELEPDASLAGQIRSVEAKDIARVRVLEGVLGDLPAAELFDTILYIDVLEHIENDAQEFERAMGHVREGGHLVVLAPAHEALRSPFDDAVGHFRRYDAASLRALGAGQRRCEIAAMRYLDAVGLLASLANRVFLRASMPKVSQVLFWDRFLVPASRLLDPVLGYRVGKSIIGIWRVKAEPLEAAESALTCPPAATPP
jgi:SAM-dependent methyltransferase